MNNYPNAHWVGTDRTVPQLLQKKHVATLVVEIPAEPTEIQREVLFEIQWKSLYQYGNIFVMNPDWGNGGLWEKFVSTFGYPEFVEKI